MNKTKAKIKHSDEIEVKISKKLKGLEIEKITCKDRAYGFRNYVKYCYVDAGDINIYLDNGLNLACWNSEWGGIKILKKGEDRI